MRLGGTRSITVDVRIITATNKVLREAAQRGEFREDLFYRLNVMPLFIPPLRDRKEDIVPLALDIMQRYNRELNKNFTGFAPDAAAVLEIYPWPGNIRELKNAIERTMILALEGDIGAADLPEEIRDFEPANAAERVLAMAEHTGEADRFISLRELEDRYINEVLAATGNNKAQAARILGIHTTSLLRRLKKKESEELVPGF